MTLFGLFVNLVFLGQAFTIMLVYIWSRRNPYVRMNFFGLLIFQAPFLPWVLMGFSLLLGNSIIVDLLGIAVGHIYFFLEDVFPNQPGGGRLLRTPSVLWVLVAALEETWKECVWKTLCNPVTSASGDLGGDRTGGKSGFAFSLILVAKQGAGICVSGNQLNWEKSWRILPLLSLITLVRLCWQLFLVAPKLCPLLGVNSDWSIIYKISNGFLFCKSSSLHNFGKKPFSVYSIEWCCSHWVPSCGGSNPLWCSPRTDLRVFHRVTDSPEDVCHRINSRRWTSSVLIWDLRRARLGHKSQERWESHYWGRTLFHVQHVSSLDLVVKHVF